MNLFKKPDPKEEIRKQNQELRKASREVEKTKRDLERNEKTLEMEIKKAAKAGDRAACATYAKQLVQLRRQKTRTVTAASQIGAVSSHTKVMQANQKLAGAMAATAKTMGSVNKSMNPVQVMNTMQNFEKENAKMEMTGEMMDDALESALGHSDDEAEESAYINQVLDEIGIEISGKLAAAPIASGTIGSKASNPRLTDSALEEQLAKLKM